MACEGNLPRYSDYNTFRSMVLKIEIFLRYSSWFGDDIHMVFRLHVYSNRTESIFF